MVRDVSEIFQYRLPTLLGPTLSLEEFRGRALLIVNTASGCSFSRQMPALQRLHAAYASEGFSVLAFPSNDFSQEPLRDAALTERMCGRWGADYPIFDVTRVRGKDKHPIFRALTEAGRPWLGREILWNFEKFLVGRDGRFLGRWRTPVPPSWPSLRRAVHAAVSRV